MSKQKPQKRKSEKPAQPVIPKKPAGHADDSGCVGCCYHDPEPTAIGTCNFCYINGKLRGCPVEGCTKKLIGEKATLSSRIAPPEKSIPWVPKKDSPGTFEDREEKPWEQPKSHWSGFPRKVAWELYRNGKNDGEIAEHVAVTRQTIRAWRNKHGLPPHPNKGRPRKNGAE